MVDSNEDIVTQINGNTGGEPEQKEGSEYINFSVAVTQSYKNKITRWVRVGTKKPELVAFVKANIHKGTPVAVEGYLKVDSWNGKPSYNLTATRIGVVTYAPKPESNGQQPAAAGAGGFNWG